MDLDRLEKNLAQVVSHLFHPVFMPLIGVFLVFQTNLYFAYTINDFAKELIYFLVFLNCTLIPGIATFYMYKQGLISSMAMEDRRERWMPYIIAILFYGFTFILFKERNLPSILYHIVLGAGLGLVMLLVFNFMWKISAHMVGIGGLIGIFFSLSQTYLIDLNLFIMPMIMVAGIIGTARLILNAHKPFELYAGLVIGFFCEYLTITLL